MIRIDLQKIIHIDYLIHIRRTGNPAEFARKVGMSRSTLFEYMAYMRDELEVCIAYNRYAATYYYEGTDLYTALGNKLSKKN